MREEDYNYIRGIEGRSSVSHDEALRLKNIYGEWVNPVRAKVLDHTCRPCVSEIWSSLLEYIGREDFKISK